MKKCKKNGVAIPLVLMFCFCTVVLAISMFHFRTESKHQNLVNTHFIQVNFLAQSAIQHMILKISAFPQDVYDAGVMSLGYCPFRGIQFAEEGDPNPPPEPDLNSPFAQDDALIVFASDCNTEKMGWKIPSTINVPAENGGGVINFNSEHWKYEIESMEVISAYFRPSERLNVLSAQLVAIGEGTMERGGMGTRKEELTRTIKLTSQN